jgi:hypothetical protein
VALDECLEFLHKGSGACSVSLDQRVTFFALRGRISPFALQTILEGDLRKGQHLWRVFGVGACSEMASP